MLLCASFLLTLPLRAPCQLASLLKSAAHAQVCAGGPARAEGWVQSPDLQKLSNCPLMTAAAVDSAGAKLSTHDHERLHTGSAGAHPIENFLRALRARTTATTIPTTTSASISAFAFGVCVMFSLSHTHTHTLGAESTEGRTRGNSA